MKTGLKLIVAASMVAALFLTNKAQAQDKTEATPSPWSFSIGPEFGLPTGVAKLGANFTIGATGRFQYDVSKMFALTFTAGGYHFLPKTNPATGDRYQSYGELPVKAGVKIFPVSNFYIGAEAGVAFEKLESGWGPHRLDLSPALGYACGHWDLAVHYDYLHRSEDHFGEVGLRLAYAFGL